MGLYNKRFFKNRVKNYNKVLKKNHWEYTNERFYLHGIKNTNCLSSNINDFHSYKCFIINDGIDFKFIFRGVSDNVITNRFPDMFKNVLDFFKTKSYLIVPIFLLISTIKFLIPVSSLFILMYLMYLPIEYLIHKILFGKLINTIKYIRKRESKNFIKHSIEIENWLEIKYNYLNTI